MKTNKELLFKGLRKLGYALVLMFLAPIVLWQAFKNQDHAFYWPVLIMGGLLALTAIYMGFLGIKTVTEAFFGKKD